MSLAGCFHVDYGSRVTASSDFCDEYSCMSQRIRFALSMSMFYSDILNVESMILSYDSDSYLY